MNFETNFVYTRNYQLSLGKKINLSQQILAEFKNSKGYYEGRSTRCPKNNLFIKLFTSKKEMMKQAFLPFLTLNELLHFSMLSKDINSIVDPNRRPLG